MATPIIEHAETAAWNALLSQSGNSLRVDPSDGEVFGSVDMRSVVRAVLRAIREPSETMERAGIDACGGDGSVLDGYEAMIDAALEEG